ncbi:MAG: GNAT family N-acetyltransferase/peptidase C39 family protein [Longimicrobiales bacterium]|nr:GNAT family N-acetyltransferase/peptidase C39 family protein [Longimicrobiales bacterium]
MSPPRIRPATPDDLDALLRLEETSFPGDRLSRRQLRHLLIRAHAALFVAEEEGRVIGSVVVLFRRNTGTAHIYSIAVGEDARGRGIGRRLLEEAEAEAWRRERAWVRAEIRKDNAPSLSLFERSGYRRFGEYEGYYDDEMDAWRVEKTLDPRLRPTLARVPYYRQTLDFTCGPAALMMAMAAFRPGYSLDRMEELRVWREATTIFMTSGHGGCGPYGLALAADRRGFHAAVVVSDPGVHMVDTVRSAEKQEVMRLVQADMEAEMRRRKISASVRPVTVEEIERRFDAGEIPVMMISSWQIYEERAPHWVVVTGFDAHFVYVNDPWLDIEEGEVLADAINMPIGRELFRRMARFGRRGLQTAVFIGAGAPKVDLGRGDLSRTDG